MTMPAVRSHPDDVASYRVALRHVISDPVRLELMSDEEIVKAMEECLRQVARFGRVAHDAMNRFGRNLGDALGRLAPHVEALVAEIERLEREDVETA